MYICQSDSTVSLFDGQVSPSRAAQALKNCKRSRRGNPVDIRKTFLFEVYKDILPCRSLFVLQNNNFTAEEYKTFKTELKGKGLHAMCIKNTVFGAAVDDSLDKSDPNGPLFKNLLVGPTLVVFSNLSDAEAPTLIKDFAQIAHKNRLKAMVIGARFEGTVLTAETLKGVVALPNLMQLRSQLVGLLSMPAQRLVGTLQQSPLTLTQLLTQHKDALSTEKKE